MNQLIIQLVLAHLIGDFVLQPSSWIAHKKEKLINSKYLYFHLAIHVLILIVVLKFNIADYWEAIIGIAISHYLIDLAKLYTSRKGEKWWHFWTDQLAHIGIIALVVFYYFPYSININLIYSIDNMLLVTMVIFVTVVSGVLMKVMIGKLYENKPTNDSIPLAGMYIGMLERVLVFTFIVLNHWQPIGFLIAAKSIFRFGDLSNEEDRKKTEYILIGTFLSFLLAIASGLFYQLILTQRMITP